MLSFRMSWCDWTELGWMGHIYSKQNHTFLSFYFTSLSRAFHWSKCKLTPSFVGTVSSFQNRMSTLLDPFHSANSKYLFPPRARLSGWMSTNWAAICTISWGLRELYEQTLYELDLQYRQSSRRRLHCMRTPLYIYLIHRCDGKSMGDVTRTLRHPREATDIVKTFVHRLINKA